MKYIFKSLLLAAAVLAAASCAKDDTQSSGEETAGPVIVNASPAAIGGEIILKLKTEASGIVEKSRAQGVSKGSGIDEIDRILNTVNTVRFERLFPDGGRFEERTRREGLHLWYYAKYDPSVPTSEMASLLSSCKDIEIIEYSLAAETSDYRRTASPAAGAQSVTRAIEDEVRNVPFPFNESERSQQMQWHYNNTGNVFAQASRLGADANVYAAWQLSTGDPDVIVAVVDQGVKYDHEDLAANMWVNEAELNGTPGVDDDGNGYVDDIYGYNFTKGDRRTGFLGRTDARHARRRHDRRREQQRRGCLRHRRRLGQGRRREDHVVRDSRQVGVRIVGRRTGRTDPRHQVRRRQRRRDLPEQLGDTPPEPSP